MDFFPFSSPQLNKTLPSEEIYVLNFKLLSTVTHAQPKRLVNVLMAKRRNPKTNIQTSSFICPFSMEQYTKSSKVMKKVCTSMK